MTVSFWLLISDRVDVIFSFQRIPAKIAKTNFHLKYKKILFSNFTHLVIAVIVAVIIFPLDMVHWCRLTNSKKFDQSCGKQQKVLVFLSPLPYYPLSSWQIFLPLILAPTGFHDWGLVTRWAQQLITSLLPTLHVERSRSDWGDGE